MGVPLCLSSAVDEKSEQENIIYGDDSGEPGRSKQ